MIKRLKENEKGLTLIELLVVIVILGIIAAIAIIAIGGIIDNSKKDAHIANAKQMANATKLYMAAEDKSTGDVTLQELINGGYTDKIKDPSSKKDGTNTGFYNDKETKIVVSRDGTNGFKYVVTLVGDKGKYTNKNNVNAMELTREDIDVDGPATTTP